MLATFVLCMAVGVVGLYLAFNHAVNTVADEVAASEEFASQTRVVAGVEYAVNENGMTYGIGEDSEEAYFAALEENGGQLSDEEALAFFPDLVAVWADEDTMGYMKGEDYYRWLSSMDNQTGIIQPDGSVISSMNLTEQTFTVYGADGVTIIGEWPNHGNREEVVYTTEDGVEVHEFSVIEGRD